MRPLVLTMQAFGPYANKEVIDFRELGNRTMFVISGKTGAGKTTIFDGISFAIYGKASGEDRMGTDLRSHFATDEVQTEVSLQFFLKGKEYYIWRAPQQEKRRARGEGYIVVNAKAELYQIKNGEKQILAANIREVEEKIKEIMQLDVNQFRQILMIPQGEFRKLLVSESKEKEIILQRLFHTFFYKTVEEELKEKAAILKQEVVTHQAQKQNQLKLIYGEGHEQLQRLLMEDEVNEIAILPLLEEQLKQMEIEYSRISNELRKSELERNLAHEKWIEAKQIIEQMNRKNELENRKRQLDKETSEIQNKQLAIEKAKKAEKLFQQEQLCQRLKRELDEKESQFKQTQIELEALQSLVTEKEAQFIQEKNKENEREQAAIYYQKLQGMKEDVFALAGWNTELQQFMKEYQENHTSLEQMNQELSTIQVKLDQLTKEKATSEEAKRKVLEVTLQIKAMNQIIEASKKLISMNQKIKQHQENDTIFKNQSHKAQSILQNEKQIYEKLEKQWLHGQAAILAQSLVDGIECPVCGSTHHPNKAINLNELPNQEDIKRARTKIEKLEKDANQIELIRQKNQAEMKMVEAGEKELIHELLELDSSVNIKQIEQYCYLKEMEKQSLVANYQELQEVSSQFEKIGRLIEEQELQKNSKVNVREQLIQKERQLEIVITEKETVIQRLKKMIPEPLQEKKRFILEMNQAKLTSDQLMKKLEIAQKEHIDAQNAQRSCKGKLDTYESVKKEVTNRLQIEKDKFVQILEELGFVNYKEYDAAKRSSNDISRLEEEILMFREEYRSVTDQLNELLTRLADCQKPNLVQLENAIQQYDALLNQLRIQQNKLQINYDKNMSILGEINKLNETVKALEEEYKLVGHLSDIARGQNVQKITFERYVLASFLDDILYLANGRLTKMTSGRYQLLRKKERSKGNVQSGLELLIFDQYTGQERHVKTLSGGESFKASLALALGLADVVQEYAGGVSLETMFIDEGFGTLDPESLDHAIETLMDIQSSGRLVGIISHVPELKERIDARLEVIATQEGSRTQFVLGVNSPDLVLV